MKSYKSNSPTFSISSMTLVVLSVVITSSLYYFISKFIMANNFNLIEFIMIGSVISIFVTGGYQIYFWAQKVQNNKPFYLFETQLDRKIPFWPKWVWIYTPIYYGLFGISLFSIENYMQLIVAMFGGILLVFLLAIFFILIPVKIPVHWNDFEADTISKKFLKFVKNIDDSSNCFPSPHMTLLTYCCYISKSVLSFWMIPLILIVGTSCLVTKQHYIYDLIPGILLGWIFSELFFTWVPL